MSTPAQSMLRCPFCDNADLDSIVTIDTVIHGEDTQCLVCYASAPRDQWNTRPAQAQEAMRAALEQLAECDLNEGNCASLDVANRRIRHLARTALSASKPTNP